MKSILLCLAALALGCVVAVGVYSENDTVGQNGPSESGVIGAVDEPGR